MEEGVNLREVAGRFLRRKKCRRKLRLDRLFCSDKYELHLCWRYCCGKYRNLSNRKSVVCQQPGKTERMHSWWIRHSELDH